MTLDPLHWATNQFTRTGRISMIIDGQFGSTGKGSIAAALAQGNECDIATTNASANAGHTTVIGDRKFVTFHTPTFGVLNTDCLVYLNAGAIIEPKLLLREIEEFGLGNRLMIHPHAAIITDEAVASERLASSGAAKIASTQKGVGAAQCAKMSRLGPVAKDIPELAQWVGHVDLTNCLNIGQKVVAEVPQGFGLSINSGFYPYTTCREVSVAQALSDAGVHPEFLAETCMIVRTFPIRVGNLLDAEGNEIGYSGPGYADQQETTWEQLGQTPERTTVTKRIRRIFRWSNDQYTHSLDVLRPSLVALSFCDYLPTRDSFLTFIDAMAQMGKAPDMCAIGPDVADWYSATNLGFDQLQHKCWPRADNGVAPFLDLNGDPT